MLIAEVARIEKAASDASLFLRDALDPPRSDFNVLASVPQLRLDSGHPGLASFWRRFLAGSELSNELNEGMIVSRDRADGARLAGDNFWESEQGFAESDFSNAAAIQMGDLILGESLLEPWRRALGSVPTTDSFSEAEESVLLQAGANQSTISLIEQLTAGDNAFSGETVSALHLQTMLMVSRSVGTLVQAIGVRHSQLGREPMTLPSEVRSRLDGAIHVIGERMDAGEVSMELKDLISDLIEQVRTLIKANSNFDDLRGDLEFAYGGAARLPISSGFRCSWPCG